MRRSYTPSIVFVLDLVTLVKVFKILNEFKNMRLTFKRSLKILDSADYISLTDLLYINLKMIGHLNRKVLILCRPIACFRFKFLNF